MNVQHEIQKFTEKQKKLQKQQQINQQVHQVLRTFEKLGLDEKRVIVNYADTIVSQGNQLSPPEWENEEEKIQKTLHSLSQPKLITVANIMQRQIETAENLESTMNQSNEQEEDIFDFSNHSIV